MVSSTNLNHKWGIGGSFKDFDLKLFHKQVGYEGADGGTHNCTMHLFIILTLEEVSVFKVELQFNYKIIICKTMSYDKILLRLHHHR